MVSIHRPLGYGPSTLPLRHSALPYCSLAVGSRALIAEIHCGKTALSVRSTCVNSNSEIEKYFQCEQRHFIEFAAVEVCQAEDGSEPSTSGLWAQHASAAPL